jgi:hypothetical protein
LFENGTFKYTFALVSRYSREQTDSAEPPAQVALRGRKKPEESHDGAAQNDPTRSNWRLQSGGIFLAQIGGNIQDYWSHQDISGRAKMRRIL